MAEVVTPNDMQTRYERAQTLIKSIFAKNKIRNTTVFPIWIEGSHCFWYERALKQGKEFRLVNAKSLSNKCAFGHKAFASSLSEAAQQKVDENNLPISRVEITLDPQDLVSKITFTAFEQRWFFSVVQSTCTALDNPVAMTERVSPDGRYALFQRDYNLWLRDLISGEERALTEDGEEDFVYVAPGSAWGFEQEPNPQPQAIFSPDSKQIFTVQRDTRQVKTLPIVHHVPQDGSIRPTVEHAKVTYPGDDHVETLRLVVIDLESGRLQAAHYPQIPTTRNSFGFFSSNLGWWAEDSQRAYFVDVDRYYKSAKVVEFNTHDGECRVLFEEHSDTHINLMLNNDEPPTFAPLPESNELLWFSERSGWAHLYLYDLETGALKNTVTQGEWLVRDIVAINTDRREVFIQTAGRDQSRDPYYRDLCRVHLDTSELTPLTDSDHEYWATTLKNMCIWGGQGLHGFNAINAIASSGDFAVVTRSRVDELPTNLLLDRDGKVLLDIEPADITDIADHWHWPEPFKVTAADSHTDLYGVLYKPSDYNEKLSYPVIVHGFWQPELPTVSKGSFTNGVVLGSFYLDAAALAELGFIVVQLDTRGTGCRHRSFYDESYGWAEGACNLDDLVAGVRQLAKDDSSMDLNRVGITSHFTGGPGGVQGLLHYPDFFKVGATTMLHDSRLFGSTMWGDKYEGGTAHDHPYPEALVENLNGKLLIMHGMLDLCSPATNTFRLIEALHKANKDFDMLMLPNLGHDQCSYFTRRTWDHFVTHLMGVTPPREFKLTAGWEMLAEGDIV